MSSKNRARCAVLFVIIGAAIAVKSRLSFALSASFLSWAMILIMLYIGIVMIFNSSKR
ncbi:hypothetical protein [Vagococcus acidifermentans]|uniref:hypothetical protein n=1 Tax=Vagococcus acidifermentans TaxID=564710 RepID=UPI001477558E|nr:hypothetical protein [Vagococcus acidifermentans]